VRTRVLVWLAAGVMVVALVAAAAGVVLWRSGRLPGAGPSGAAGVTFNDTGRHNARLFGAKDLLALAAPWLDDSACRKRTLFAQDSERVECTAKTCCWTIDFELRQSDGARALAREEALRNTEAPHYRAFTFAAPSPRSGLVAMWHETGRQQCRAYWDDDTSRATAQLHQTEPDPGAEPPLCWTDWDSRVRPATLVRQPA
jgi:hypothetical protein